MNEFKFNTIEELYNKLLPALKTSKWFKKKTYNLYKRRRYLGVFN